MRPARRLWRQKPPPATWPHIGYDTGLELAVIDRSKTARTMRGAMMLKQSPLITDKRGRGDTDTEQIINLMP
jgi:hypothetical protein